MLEISRCDNTGLIACDRNVNPGTETKEIVTSDLTLELG